MKVLSGKQFSLLVRAVAESESWRGAIVGNPDPEPLEAFDETIRQMKECLSIVREQQMVLRGLRRAARKRETETVCAYVGLSEGGCLDIGRFDFK